MTATIGTFIANTLMAVSLQLPSTAVAHGDFQPKHGGLMSKGGETSFEMVVEPGGVTIYVEDHGEPVQTRGFRGVARVAGAGQRSAELVPSGKNTLLAKDFLPAKGERVLLQVDFGNGTAAGAYIDVR